MNVVVYKTFQKWMDVIKNMKTIFTECPNEDCNSSIGLSSNLIDEAEAGVLGVIKCPDCKSIVLPEHLRERASLEQ